MRKLFPSAKESGSTMLSPEQNDRPLCQHNGEYLLNGNGSTVVNIVEVTLHNNTV